MPLSDSPVVSHDRIRLALLESNGQLIHQIRWDSHIVS